MQRLCFLVLLGLWIMLALEKTRNFNYLADFYLILEPFLNGNTLLWHRHFSSRSKPGIHVLSRALTNGSPARWLR